MAPEIPGVIGLFLERKEAVLQQVREQQGLTDKMRSRALKFISAFYDEIANPERVERKFLKQCPR